MTNLRCDTSEFEAGLRKAQRQIAEAFASAVDAGAVEAARVEYLGAKGLLKNLTLGLGNRQASELLSEVKKQAEADFNADTSRLAGKES